MEEVVVSGGCPENENVWKIIFSVAEHYLSENDKLNIRLVCYDAKCASDNYIRFSQKQFDSLVRRMKNYNCNLKQDLVNWTEIEKQLESLIAANQNDSKFQKKMLGWLEVMDANFPDIKNYVSEREHYVAARRPSFQKGLKKIGRAAVGSIGAIGAVVTLPLAVVSIPFLFSKNRGVQTGGMCLAAPFGLAITFATEKFSDACSDRNVRDIPAYLRMCQCIARVKTLLAQSALII